MMRLRAVAEQTKIELSRRSRAVVRDRRDRVRPARQAARSADRDHARRVRQRRSPTSSIARSRCARRRSRTPASTIDEIDDVILVGGTTKIPYVRDQVAKFFAQARRAPTSRPRTRSRSAPALQATSLERILKRKSPSKVTGAQKVPQEFLDDEHDADRETISERVTDPQATQPDTTSRCRRCRPTRTASSSLLPRIPRSPTHAAEAPDRRLRATMRPAAPTAPARVRSSGRARPAPRSVRGAHAAAGLRAARRA